MRDTVLSGPCACVYLTMGILKKVSPWTERTSGDLDKSSAIRG